MKHFLVCGLFLLLSCTTKPSKVKETLPNTSEKHIFNAGAIYADNQFKGARLNAFAKINDTIFQATISPESTPINNSPWFGFRIWSEKETTISLDIVYTDGYKHRYIPKLSSDGISWKPLEEKYIHVDSLNGKVRMDLHLTPKKLWISSQENLHTDYIAKWVDSLAKNDIIEKQIIGKSVQGLPLPLLKIKEGNPKYAIIILGRQHPTEVPGGTISLMAFVNTILSQTPLATNFRGKFEIVVIPLLNPDGVNAGNWRYNANGVDLNRDWVLFSQPETKAVRTWMQNATKNPTHPKYSFGIDFHTSYSGPYLLTLDTIPHTIKPRITSKWIQNIENRTGDTLDIRPRAQSLPYCYNWFINEVGIESVTYEEGDEIDRSIVKLRAKNYAITLMETLIQEKYNQN